MREDIPRQPSITKQATYVAIVIGLLTIFEVVNALTGRQMNNFGLIPREFDALAGILFSPFLHGSLTHFSSNVIPLTIFMFFALQYGRSKMLYVSMFLIVVSGALVWLVGRHAIHIGSSGLLYGYFGFLLLAGFISRQPSQILISLFVGLVYGGLIFGVLPSGPYVSWEFHLFGFLAGLAAARLFVQRPQS